jgi:hypothetical protein
MELPDKLAALTELAQSLGITVRGVRYEAEQGERKGGSLVRLRGEEILFLDTSSSLADQIDAVASALAGRGELDGRFLPPEIRQTIEDAAEG